MTFPKPAFFFILLIFVGVLISACVSQTALIQQVSEPHPLTTVKVGYLPLISNGPLYIAKEEGYFAQQGIDVEFEKFPSAAMALPPLINGDIAVSGGTLTPGLINSIVKGAHVRIVADKGRMAPGYCASTALMVRRDLHENGTIMSPSDLKGRKLMGSSDQIYGIYRSLAMGNLTSDDVQLVNMDMPSAALAFQNGAIDAAIMSEPYITETLNSGSAVILVPAQNYSPNYPTPLYYGPTFLDQNPELGEKFMVAYLQGVKQYNKGKTERNLEILQNYTNLDQDLLKQACWVAIDQDGSIEKQPVQDYIDWMYDNKQIPQKLEADQLFDTRYVTYANTVLGNITPAG
jgi:NitT/TauT family transport system substrate-binding protein